MPFALSASQRTALQTLRNSFPDVDSAAYSRSLNYYEMYVRVLSYVEAWEAAGNALTLDEKITKIWLKGVIEVNQGVGLQSDFIRDYNSAQKELRFGSTISDAEMDKASDRIALDVIDRILNPNEPDLPAVGAVAGVDVATVSSDLLNNDPSGWAGNPLLLFLGYDQAFNDNILNSSRGTYDLLAAIKVMVDLGATTDSILDGTFFRLLWNSYDTASDADAVSKAIDAMNAASDKLGDAYGALAPIGDVVVSNIVLDRLNNNATLYGTTSDNYMHGADGDDTLIGSAGDDVLDGGKGTDTADYSLYNKATVNIASFHLDSGGVTFLNGTFGVEAQVLRNIEKIVGTGFRDFFFGNASANTLAGGGGADELRGGGGADVLYDATIVKLGNVYGPFVRGFDDILYGEAGNDTLVSHDGVDALYGGANSDTLIKLSPVTLAGGIVDGGSGNDVIWAEGNSSVIGGAGADTIWLGGGARYNYNTADAPVAGVTDTLIAYSGGSILDETAAGGKLENTRVVVNPGGGAGLSLHYESYTNSTLWLGNVQIKGTFTANSTWDHTWSLGNGWVLHYNEGGGAANPLPFINIYAPDTPLAGSVNIYNFTNNDFGITITEDTAVDDDGVAPTFAKPTSLGFAPTFLTDYASVPLYPIPGVATLTGTAAAETFHSGLRSLAITGAGDTDTFKLVNTYGSQSISITDFRVAADAQGRFEKVDITALGGNRSVVLRQVGADTRVELITDTFTGATASFTLAGVSAAALTKDHFEGEGTLTVSSFVSAAPSSADDTISGTAGNDTLRGLDGNDLIYGLAGNDALYGDAGADTLLGGDGNDSLFGGEGRDFFDGGAGLDTADFTGTLAWTVDLAAGTARRAGDSTTLSETVIAIERLNLGSGNDTVVGSAEAETVSAGEGNDSVAAGGGNDSLVGSLGNDSLDGGEGNDTVSGGAGANRLSGGLGTDRFVIGSDTVAASDTITDFNAAGGEVIDLTALGTGLTVSLVRGSGLTSFTVGTRSVTLTGVDASSLTLANFAGVAVLTAGASAFADSLTGSAGADTIDGLGGNDTISGLGGNDTLLGNSGDDVLIGGVGADRLDGGSGADTASYAGSTAVVVNLTTGAATGGHAAADVLVAIEHLIGSGGADALTGTTSANSLSGGAGNDTLVGDSGSDTLDGGDGDDSMDGGSSSDTLMGSAGADMMIGGTSADTFDFSRSPAAVVVNLTSGIGSGGWAAGDVFSGGEHVLGSIYADSITGSADTNDLFGLAGNDTLRGDAGRDTLDGGDGNDMLYGGTDSDRLTDAAGTNQMFGEAGNDTLLGGVGAETLNGGADNDSISAGAGNDSVLGDVGDDTMDGGLGADTINGGLGLDTLTYDAATAAVNVNLRTGVGLGAEAAGDVISGIERLIGSDFADTLTGSINADTIEGGRGNNSINGDGGNDSLRGSYDLDTILGGAGADTMDGSSGNDSLRGGTENDSIIGGSGNDLLFGDGGADLLEGGSGVDTLTGGTEADIFRFGYSDTGLISAAAADRIVDFSRTQGDKIELDISGISATGFVGTGAFTSGGAREFGYTKTTIGGANATVVRIDYTNDGVTDREIILQGIHIDLVAADFLF